MMKRTRRTGLVAACMLAVFAASARPAAALDRLCDPGNENCRTILINYIRAEKVGIDVGFWFMEDANYTIELIKRFNAGVPVRVLMDVRANASTPRNITRLQELSDAGIPMRTRTASGIMHYKMMLFAGQNIVEFSGANFSVDAWLYAGTTPYVNYVDESIYFTDNLSFVHSFMTKFDDLWTNTTTYSNYANISAPLARTYQSVYITDPQLNFPPLESYAKRAIGRYKLETQKIDVIMYRITDRRHTDAMIAAKARNVPIRLISEPQQYRDATRLWDAWNIDRMYMAGIPIKMRAHAGLNHEKLVLLYGQKLSIFGSSNWTSPSDASQEEHNCFCTDLTMFDWFTTMFERKWNNTAGVVENTDFVPLPPGKPVNQSPANMAAGMSPASVLLKWYGGPWGHRYDVLLGTDAFNLQPVLFDAPLGPSESATDYQSYSLTNLLPGTTYYWRVVSRTMADLSKTGDVWTFTTTGTAPPPEPLPSPWAHADIGAVGLPGDASFDSAASVFTVKGAGADIWGTADAFHFAYRSLSGDGSIVARVASVSSTASWMKAGVMIRGSLAANAAQALMLVSYSKGLAFQRRTSAGGITTSTAGALSGAPYWVRLDRAGTTISAYQSPDGTSWTLVGKDTFALGGTVYLGLAVSSHTTSTLGTATFANVSAGASAPALPAPWAHADIGVVGTAGGASFDATSSVFTVRGAGADIWGTADAFHFVYQSLAGDGSIVARVGSVSSTAAWVKAGVMIRGSLSASSAQAMMLVSYSKGLAFQRRTASGATSTSTPGAFAGAPYWVRLDRAGATISAYQSVDGVNWALVGTDTFVMGTTVYVGLAVSSHTTSAAATGTFGSVSAWGQ